MKIYISGKITGLPYDAVVAKFNKAAEQVKAFGYEPVNPLQNGLTPLDEWKEHMKVDVAMLFDCDGIYLLGDWSESAGARIELKIAEELGLLMMRQPEYAY